MITVPCWRGSMTYELGENDEFIVTPDVPPETVAHGLSHVSRFGGQTERPYYVGEHSVRLGWLLRDRGFGPAHEKAAQLHDAPECFGIGDMNSFVKRLVDARRYRELDTAICRALWRHFDCEQRYGLDWEAVDAVVRPFDKWLGHWEASRLGFHVPEDAKFDPEWGKGGPSAIQMALLLGHWSPAQTKEAWLWNWRHADGRP